MAKRVSPVRFPGRLVPTGRENYRIVFITGTDTGVGKTVLTGLLLRHLRGAKVHALALKPFCSGSRADARLLRSLQDRELELDEVNPYYFTEPLAPLVAARLHDVEIQKEQLLAHIRRVAASCECLLIEGSGGLLVPLAERFTLLDMVAALRAEVIVVARNRLGTLNHTLLTVQTLRAARIEKLKVVLFEPRFRDPSSLHNPRVLTELLRPSSVAVLPNLGARANSISSVVRNADKLKRRLAKLMR